MTMIAVLELGLVLGLGFAWGLYELRSLRRDRLAREAAARRRADPSSQKP